MVQRHGPATSRERLWLAVILGLFLVTGLSVLPSPFTRDQGVYAYTAWRWLEGDVPYLHTFDHKGPLLYAIYAIGLTLSGGAMWGPNLLDLLARAAAIWLAWAAARRLLHGAAPLLVAALAALPLFGHFNSVWYNAQAETFMLPLVAGSAWLCLRAESAARPRQRLVLVALAGLLAGQAALLKPTAALHGLFLLAWLWLAGRQAWRAPLVFAAGAAAGGVPWLIYLAITGALGAMAEILIGFNSFHLAGGSGTARPLAQAVRGGLWPIFNIALFLPLIPLVLRLLRAPRPSAAAGGTGRDRTEPSPAAFVIGWLLVSALQTVVQGKYFPYHWLTLIPAMALAAGAGLQSLVDFGEAHRRRALAAGAVAAALLWLTVAQAGYWVRLETRFGTFDYALGRITRDQFWERFREGRPGGRGDFNLLASARAAEIARERIPEGGRLLVFGFEPIVNWLARRPAPTRFIFDYPLTFTPRSERAARHRERWRAEFLADLRARPPELVMLVDNDVNPLEPIPSVRQAAEWPELRAWLEENYRPVGALEDFHILERKR